MGRLIIIEFGEFHSAYYLRMNCWLDDIINQGLQRPSKRFKAVILLIGMLCLYPKLSMVYLTANGLISILEVYVFNLICRFLKPSHCFLGLFLNKDLYVCDCCCMMLKEMKAWYEISLVNYKIICICKPSLSIYIKILGIGYICSRFSENKWEWI